MHFVSFVRQHITGFAKLKQLIIIIIIILFIERHIQRAVRGAVQHSKAALSVIIDIQVNYYF